MRKIITTLAAVAALTLAPAAAAAAGPNDHVTWRAGETQSGTMPVGYLSWLVATQVCPGLGIGEVAVVAAEVNRTGETAVVPGCFTNGGAQVELFR